MYTKSYRSTVDRWAAVKFFTSGLSSRFTISPEYIRRIHTTFWWLNKNDNPYYSDLPHNVKMELVTWALCHMRMTTKLPKDVFKLICRWITTVRSDEERTASCVVEVSEQMLTPHQDYLPAGVY